MRDSVLLYRSQIDALRGLPPEQFKKAMLAITDYAMDGAEPDEDPVTMAVFTLTKPLIDKNNKRYENGVKGGRPEPTNNQTVTKQEPNHNQTITKLEPNSNLKEKGERIKEKDNIDSSNKLDELTRERVIDAWNSLQPQGITPIKVIAAESKRGHMLKARIQQYSVDGVINAINSVNEQAFLHGQEWFTFDWFIKPNNFVKVFEGNYKGRAKPEVKNKFVNMDARTDNADKYAQLEQAQAKPVEDWAALERALLGGQQ